MERWISDTSIIWQIVLIVYPNSWYKTKVVSHHLDSIQNMPSPKSQSILGALLFSLRYKDTSIDQ